MYGLRSITRTAFSCIAKQSLFKSECLRTLATVPVVHNAPPPPLPFNRTPIIDPKKIVEQTAPSLVSLIDSYFTPSPVTLNTEMQLPTASHHPKEIWAELINGVNKSLLRVRRDKMNKHRLRKFRKKYLALIKKVRLRREIKKEKLFRAELLAQIKEAEDFDAEKYVKNILSTIKNTPRRETIEESKERVYRLKLQYRSNVDLMPPIFEDQVPRRK
ncbi:hypothetical protein HDE_05226 [Halotydeus destructor]|nr:hypothetical protein HDE_05226 [Halotydeus destructor]